MQNCSNCLWCRKNTASKKKYKCAIYPKSRKFDVPWLHGFMCCGYRKLTEELKRLKAEQEMRKHAEH